MAKEPKSKPKVKKGCKYEGVYDEITGLIMWKSHGNVTTLSTDPPPPPPVLPGPK